MASPTNLKSKRKQLTKEIPGNTENQTYNHQYDRTIDLDKLNEDVITIPPAKSSKVHRSNLKSGAMSIMVNNKNEEIRHIESQSQIAPKIYVENCLGFRKQAIQQMEFGITDENQEIIKKSLKVDKNILNSNPGIKYVVRIQRTFRLLSYTLFGLLAGASLAHTLFLQMINSSQIPPTMKDVNFNLVMRYSEIARPIAITYFVALVITGIYILDKFDFSRPSANCMKGCIKFQNGVLAIPFLTASFGINNAMIWLDYQIHQLAYPQYIITIQNVEDNIASVWKIWCILDASRTAFILATWIILSFCGENYDRMIRNLYRDLDQEINK